MRIIARIAAPFEPPLGVAAFFDAASGIYRVMYVVKFEEAIYVLHCFQKKAQATSKQDKAIAAARYRAVASARKERK